MDKITFLSILQASILAYDGLGLKELINCGFSPQIAQAGIRLANYGKRKELLKC